MSILIVGILAAPVTTKSAVAPAPSRVLLPSQPAEETLAAKRFAELYSTQVRLLPSGEPLVRVGIAYGRSDVALQSAQPLVLRCEDDKEAQERAVPAGRRIAINVLHAGPATQRYFIDLGVVTRTQRLQTQMQHMRSRGLASVMPLFEGAILGLGGRMLDNRTLHLVVPAADRNDAKARQEEIANKTGMSAGIRPQLDVPPQGSLRLAWSIGASEAQTMICDNMVQLTSAGEAPIEVLDVEYARGYAWHGHANRLYSGDIYVAIGTDAKMAVINEVGAETLLQGVVPAEIYPSAPPEALKAQAVAARNTLFSKLGKRHAAEPFVMCGEQHCQVYAGIGGHDPRTTAAVTATRGEALFLRGALVDAVYSASCGGHTEDNEAVWSDAPNPALRARLDVAGDAASLKAQQKDLYGRGLDTFWRATPDAFCRLPAQAGPERFRWRKVFDQPALNALVAAAYPHVPPLRDVQIVGRGKGGRVVSLRLVGARHNVTVQRELPIRQLFENLNSAAFAIETARDAAGNVQKITFIGGGWGHGVGLCQLGAMGRAQKGRNYQQILAHYYNGAQVEPLY